jgi:flagellar motor switch protein FliN/FliY
MANDNNFDDPLQDIDPIMEQAFSVNDDDFEDTLSMSEEEESDVASSIGFEQSDIPDPLADEPAFPPYTETYEDDVEEIDGLAPVVSDLQFPSLSDEESGQRYEPDVFSNIPVQVSVELGRSQISLKEIFELSEGSIIELERMVGEPLDLVVNGQVVAQGEVVAIDNNYGLRVTGIKADDQSY